VNGDYECLIEFAKMTVLFRIALECGWHDLMDKMAEKDIEMMQAKE
jgi:hypothetical protein